VTGGGCAASGLFAAACSAAKTSALCTKPYRIQSIDWWARIHGHRPGG
jgi:hypothetical protein